MADKRNPAAGDGRASAFTVLAERAGQAEDNPIVPSGQQVRSLAEKIHAAGPRPLAELIREIVAHTPELRARLEAYARLDPAVLRILGADRFPAAPLYEVRR